MTKFSYVILFAVSASTAAFAQAPAVGVTSNVQGLVTIIQGNTMGNLSKDTPIPNGARIVTTSTGFANLQLNNGCAIALTPNQAITIDSQLDCKTQIAGVVPVGGPVVAGGSNNFLLPALIAGGFGISQITSNSSTPSQRLSGS